MIALKKDITTRRDIEIVIYDFYQSVQVDEVIGYIFGYLSAQDWVAHMPVMVDFWESVVFMTGSYNNNPMEKHISLHQSEPLTKAHFAQWIMLFHKAVDERYAGTNAQLMKDRAQSIAIHMEFKILGNPPL